MRYLYIGRDLCPPDSAFEYNFGTTKLMLESESGIFTYCKDGNCPVSFCEEVAKVIGFNLKPGQQIRIPVDKIQELISEHGEHIK